MSRSLKLTLFLALAGPLALATLAARAGETQTPTTFCNPLNLEYRFQLDEPSRREAADPVIVLYQGDYYLFASKSGGYWHSTNLRDWTLVAIADGVLPIEDYAPTVLIKDGIMVFQAGSQVYKSTNPKAGQWTKVADIPGSYLDPALFQDEDGRVYLYYGGSPTDPLHAVELDKDFKPLGKVADTLKGDAKSHGWELSGTAQWPITVFPDSHVKTGGGPTYIEGSWMNKRGGIYYLQYAAPGTQWQIYGDGAYTAKSPLGPFTYAPNNPVSYKPTGFIGGAGHGCTFQSKDGKYWHVTTMVVADKHWFERRLGIFPTGFDKDGLMQVNTYLGDYPQLLAGAKENPEADNLAGWWLLSYGKKAEASSTLDAAHSTAKAFDENVRSAWSARTGEKGEWLSVDLGKTCRINAVQINFAEQDTKALGRKEKLYHQYLLEASGDGQAWRPLVDKSQNQRDVPHDYVELDQPAQARYVKLTNVHYPGEGKFSVRDLRVFGSGLGEAPARVTDFTVQRDKSDRRSATISWQPAEGAEGYVIRYGIAPGKLYENYQTRGRGPVTLDCLNTAADYSFTIDAFNDSGLTKGQKVQPEPTPGPSAVKWDAKSIRALAEK